MINSSVDIDIYVVFCIHDFPVGYNMYFTTEYNTTINLSKLYLLKLLYNPNKVVLQFQVFLNKHWSVASLTNAWFCRSYYISESWNILHVYIAYINESPNIAGYYKKFQMWYYNFPVDIVTRFCVFALRHSKIIMRKYFVLWFLNQASHCLWVGTDPLCINSNTLKQV